GVLAVEREIPETSACAWGTHFSSAMETVMKAAAMSVLLMLAVLAAPAAAQAQAARPGAVVRVDPAGTSDESPAQPDKAFKPQERDDAMKKKPENGCSCASNNRCAHSFDFNYCIAADGHRVYLQRYWGQ